MLVIRKKRVILFIIFVVVSVYSYTLFMVNDKAYMETVAVPVTNKVIILDAGHGLPDEGCVGINGTTEQEINLKLVLKLQKLIEQSGGTAILTRVTEKGIYQIDNGSIRRKKVADMKNRVNIGNNNYGDVFVSIHLNKFPDSRYSGWQTFHQTKNQNSIELASNIQNALNKNINKKNDRVPLPIHDIYIMKNVKIPSVIVECGFLSNPVEVGLLQKEDYQNKIVWGIFTGIQEYFNK